MRRRALLSAVACSSVGGTAGCLDRLPVLGDDSCDGASIERASIRVVWQCYTRSGQASTVVAHSDSCDGELTIEMAQNDEVLLQRTESGDGGEWSFRVETENTALEPGTATVRLLDGGDVLAEETFEVHHWADEPALFFTKVPLEIEPVAVGEPVPVEFAVGNTGGAASFTVEFLAEGEVFWERYGSVGQVRTCTSSSSGPRYAVERSFEEPGEYELTGRITVDDPDVDDAGDYHAFGTVTVEPSEA